MTALVLFPSRIRFVNNDGTLTPEAFRALQEIVNRTGGTLGAVGSDTYGDIVGDASMTAVNVAYTDVTQPLAQDAASEMVAQSVSVDQTLPDIVQPVSDQNYEQFTSASTACTGAITTACVWKLTKNGNQITLTLPNVQGAGVATTNFTVGQTIPAKYRPVADIAVRGGVLINNALALAAPPLVKVLSTGVISVWIDGTEAGNFTVTANAGLKYATSISWTI